MINFFDFLTPKSSNPFADFGPRFGLTPEQTLRAVGALLPAFALGLQRRAPTPADWATLFQPASTRSADPLALFFGSRDLARPIADQAAAFTGVSASVLNEMMPAIATGLAASLGRAGTNPQSWFQPPKVGQPGDASGTRAAEESGEALGAMIAAMLGISPGKPEPKPEPEPDPIKESVEALSEIMHTSREAQEEHLRNLQGIFAKMMGGR